MLEAITWRIQIEVARRARDLDGYRLERIDRGKGLHGPMLFLWRNDGHEVAQESP